MMRVTPISEVVDAGPVARPKSSRSVGKAPLAPKGK